MGRVPPVLDVWKALPPRDFPNYSAGSWGPAAADELLRREGRAWRNPAPRPVAPGGNGQQPQAAQPESVPAMKR